MFTGIIEEIGKVEAVQQTGSFLKLVIQGKIVLEGLHLGDSIAVNGVCLTATAIGNHTFTADVMPETFRRSSLSVIKKGSLVNLERAMAANGRFGGHIVAGHVDQTGKIVALKEEGNAVWVTIEAGREVLRYVVEKGSIAIDGISLTVAYVDEKVFRVSLIPHTGRETTLLKKKVGDIVNLECDVIGKYVEKLMQTSSEKEKTSGITREFLARNGY